MLLFIILSTLFSSSIAQPRPPAGLIAKLAGDAAQAIPEGPVANVIPEEIITNNISPYMGFEEAMRTKNAFGWTDDQLVRQFSKQEPEKVEDFIFRELDNPTIDDATRLRHVDMLLNENGGRLSIRGGIQKLTIHGKVDLLHEILNRYPYLVRGLRFTNQEISGAAQRGHARIVNFILDAAQQSHPNDLASLTVHAALGSVKGNKIQVFKMIVDRETHILLVLLQAVGSDANPSFFKYGLQKIRRGLRPTAQPLPQNWYRKVVELYVLRGRSPHMLEYILTQPEWNPGTIRNLLDIMLPSFMIESRRQYSHRLAREFLNTRLSFQGADGIVRVGGTENLNVAVREALSDLFLFDIGIYLNSRNFLG
jgi:hypothetical protein